MVATDMYENGFGNGCVRLREPMYFYVLDVNKNKFYCNILFYSIAKRM